MPGTHVSINGVERVVISATVADLIAELGLEGQRIAIERNQEIVPRTAFAATQLSEGDRIEVVQFVGGG